MMKIITELSGELSVTIQDRSLTDSYRGPDCFGNQQLHVEAICRLYVDLNDYSYHTIYSSSDHVCLDTIFLRHMPHAAAGCSYIYSYVGGTPNLPEPYRRM